MDGSEFDPVDSDLWMDTWGTQIEDELGANDISDAYVQVLYNRQTAYRQIHPVHRRNIPMRDVLYHSDCDDDQAGGAAAVSTQDLSQLDAWEESLACGTLDLVYFQCSRG